MNPLETKKAYQEYVDKKTPNSPILKNCFNAFWVGGLICTIGQIILNICKERGFDTQASGTIGFHFINWNSSILNRIKSI